MYSNPTIESVLIADNHCLNKGGGISCFESSPELIAVSIVNNSAYNGGGDGQGGGFYCLGNSHPVISSSILWGNFPDEVFFYTYNDPNSIQIVYSDIENGQADIHMNDNGIIEWGPGNIDDDPLFCDPDGEEYTLAANSPCVETGESGSNMGALGVGCNAVVAIGNDVTSAPIDYTLHQNFPNPFNPTTTFTYELPQPSYVQIVVYDILGQEVATLVSENQTAGYKSVQWNAMDNQRQKVGSGMYLYVIKAGEFTQTRKMLLLK